MTAFLEFITWCRQDENKKQLGLKQPLGTFRSYILKIFSLIKGLMGKWRRLKI